MSREYALELFFDDATEQACHDALAVMSEAGLPNLAAGGYRPHISLMVADGLDRVPQERLLVEGLPMKIAFESVGTFPGAEGVAFLAPVTTRALLDVHAAVWDAVAVQPLVHSDYYPPGRWVPHCTMGLALPPDRVGEAVSILRDVIPQSGTATRAALVHIPSGQEILLPRPIPG